MSSPEAVAIAREFYKFPVRGEVILTLAEVVDKHIAALRSERKRLRSALEGVRNLAAYRANQDQLQLAVMIRDEADAALK